MTDTIYAEQGLSLRQMLLEDSEGTLIHHIYSFLHEHRKDLLNLLEATKDSEEFERLVLLESCYTNSLILMEPIANYAAAHRGKKGN